MKKQLHSAIDVYMNYTFKLLILMIPIVALFAGATFTALKLLGYYPDVSMDALALLDSTCVLYFAVGAVFVYLCEDKDGNLKPKIVSGGKFFISIVEAIQWNVITYTIPSRDFWAYAVFFVMLVIFFLDSRFVAIISGVISVSILVSWIVYGDRLLPVRDERFFAEMVLRVVFLALSFVCMWMITYFVEHRLASELERIADYDILTHLYNRRNLNKHLKESILRAIEKESRFSVLMCDLDDFKSVNDTYGHECGDEVLKSTADVIARDVSGVGTAFRYGGEEILVILETDEIGAAEIAEKIRFDVEKNMISCGESAVSVTLTVGVAVYTGKQSGENLIRCADTNMYYGKNHGKNRVVL